VQNIQGGPSGNFSAEFPRADLTVTVDGAALPYSLESRVYGYASGASVEAFFSFTVLSAYRSTFTVGGTKYTLQVSDMTGNARFDDRVDVSALVNQQGFSGRNAVRARGDMVFLSDGTIKDYSDAFILGDYLNIGNALFAVKIDIEGKKLTLTEIKTGLGSLKLSMKPERIAVYSPDKKHSVMAYRTAGDALLLPVGSYKLLAYEMYRKDDQGDLWRLVAAGTNESPAVSVTPGSPSVLPFGEPFYPVISFPAGSLSPNAGNTIMQFSVEGQGKDLLSEITHLEGAATKLALSSVRGREERPKEPAYTVLKADGEIVARGAFEYG
jgi:hypothetical protein